MLAQKLPRSLIILPKLGRVSNLPTVFSNVLIGAHLAMNGSERNIISLMLLAALFYTLGMVLNDYWDFSRDKELNKPRPLVKGEIELRDVQVLLIFIGFMIFVFIEIVNPSWWATLGLSASILLYNRFHVKSYHAVLFMGLCRFFLILMGSEKLTDLLFFHAILVFIYTCFLTSFAKRENREKFSRGEFFYFLLFAGGSVFNYGLSSFFVILPIFLVWQWGPKYSIKWTILPLISFFCLIDALSYYQALDMIPWIYFLLGGWCLMNQKWISGT